MSVDLLRPAYKEVEVKVLMTVCPANCQSIGRASWESDAARYIFSRRHIHPGPKDILAHSRPGNGVPAYFTH